MGPDRKVPPTECFLSASGHLARSGSTSAFEGFLTLLGLKKRQKALKRPSLGHTGNPPGVQFLGHPVLSAVHLWGR